MDEFITVEASKARNNFFKILDKVFTEDKTFLVKKAGIAVAEIRKPKKGKKNEILKYAGAWKNLDADKLITYINEGRKDAGKLKRTLPQW